ncbi:PD-(D/E)XK nuclease family protein [Atopobacter phocae]|uniref:PD-(D/E)XK nuclease family protein n=1 Tax=Atopobacter phocae TaxID=136492 RepID=UPI00047076F3|nr:PD-(D/E)XK nuclease family protein [Atopobacter phocae]
MRLMIKAHSISFQPQLDYLPHLIQGENEQKEQIVLVPEHIKFNAEKEMIQQLNENKQVSASFHTKVFSISRFIWSLLQGNDILNQPLPTSSVEHLIMAQSLLIVESDLTVFKGQVHFQEFIKLCLDLYHEFEAGQIDFNQLSWAEDRPELIFLKDKIHDLKKIFETFNQLKPSQLNEQEILFDAAKKAIQQLAEQNKLPQTVYISHFFRFSALEQDFILSLAQSTQVFVYLPVGLNVTSTSEALDYFNGYWPALNTLHLLQMDCPKYHLTCQIENIQETTIHHPLAEQWLTLFSSINDEQQTLTTSLEVEWLEGDTYEKEWLAILQSINELVHHKNYRYKDIVVMTRDLSRYKELIQQTVQQRQIPIFIDEPEAMDQHPLHEMIQSLERMLQPYWTGQDLIRLLRSERWLPTYFKDWSLEKWRQLVDSVETIVLALGIDQRFPLIVDQFKNEELIRNVFRGKTDDWFDLFEQHYKKLIEAIEQIREHFYSAQSLEEMTGLFYEWMQKDNVQLCTDFWRENALKEGQLELAQHEEQAWQLLINILDEFMTYHTTNQLDANRFFELIKIAFETNHYQLVPSRVDQVVVTSIDAVQFSSSPIVFIMGLDQHSLPRMGQSISLLDNRERENLSQQLRNDTASTPRFKPLKKETVATEPFIFARALSIATDYLFLSYSSHDVNHQPIDRSPYVMQLMDCLKIERKITNRTHLFHEEDIFRLFIDELSMINLIDWNASESQAKSELIELNTWHNLPESIGVDLATALYGKDLYLSVSRLENYYKDPYNYFLNYGLKLKERQLFEITQLEKGQVFHDVMERVWNKVTQHPQADWSIITMEHLTQSIHEELNQANHPILKMYDKTPYLKHVKERLSLNLHHLFQYILNTQQQLVTHDSFTEQSFERRHQTDQNKLLIPSLQYEVPIQNEKRLIQVRGRIDRLELFEVNQQPYALITDYKSGNKTLNIRDIINGTNLQVMTYLNAIKQVTINNRSIKPLGALYQSLKLNLLKQNEAFNENQLIDFSKIANAMKPKGYVLQNIDVLTDLHRDKTAASQSDLLPYKFKKEWEQFTGREEDEQAAAFNKQSSHTLTTAEFELLMKYTEWLIEQAAKDILSGHLQFAPLADTKYIDTIKSGKYHSITWFDPLFDNNQYRPLEKRSDSQKLILLNEIQNQLKGEGNGK